MKRSISYFLFLSCFLVVMPSYAGNQTLTTYYPAPQGNYLNMTVNNQLTLASQASCTQAGTNVGITDVNGALVVCDQNSGANGYALTSTSLWAHAATGNYISPVTGTQDVGIGTWAADPGFTLGVNGTAYVAGNATFGPIGGINITTINGTAIIPTIGTGASSATTINGNATLGTNSTNTTTINGTTTVNGGATVTGNTVLGTSGGAGINTTTVNGNATITGNATINGTTTICTSPGNCGTLGVSCSGGTCYAVYGP